MNLFPYEPTRNLLPFDGIANYYGPILTPREAQDYLEALLTTIPWRVFFFVRRATDCLRGS